MYLLKASPKCRYKLLMNAFNIASESKFKIVVNVENYIKQFHRFEHIGYVENPSFLLLYLLLLSLIKFL